jgi:hypothetical protein
MGVTLAKLKVIKKCLYFTAKIASHKRNQRIALEGSATHMQHTHFAWTSLSVTQTNCPPVTLHLYNRTWRQPGISVVNATSNLIYFQHL